MRLDHLLLGRKGKDKKLTVLPIPSRNGNKFVSFLFVFNKVASLRIRGSIYFAKSAKNNGGIAQLVEHLPCKQGVIGSNPIISTIMGS